MGNAWGLLRPSLELYMPDVRFRITLPKRIKRKPVAPPDDAVARLFAAASRNMKRAIALAAFSSLRRSEICALTYADLDGSWLSVNRSMVQDEHNQWIMKEIPKTSESVRMTPLPEEVVRLLGTGDPDERIVPIRPDTITVNLLADGEKKDSVTVTEDSGWQYRFTDLPRYQKGAEVAYGITENAVDEYATEISGYDITNTHTPD